MSWCHPDITLGDLMQLIKGFVDILILANGYQSSGLPAVWDAPSIKNAVRWGLFFQDVFKRINDSCHFDNSMKELDAALRNLMSNPFCPQGLVHLTSTSLSRARDLVIECLVQSHIMGAKHLTSLLTAVIEMDVNDLNGTWNANSTVYTDILMLQMESLNLVSMDRENFVKTRAASTPSTSKISGVSRAGSCNPAMPEPMDYSFAHHSCFLIHEILQRQASILCITSAETGLDSILNLFMTEHMLVPEKNSLEGKPSTGNSPKSMSELFLWSQWRSRCLSYLVDNRTIRLLSGANLIFSTPKVHWLQVLDPLKVLSDSINDHLLEIMEISLLGFISSRWTNLIGQFMSHSCDYLTISEQYSVLHCLLQENTQCAHSKMEALSSKEKDILGYMTTFLDCHYHKLWLLPPVLVAAAIPSWSILFRAFWNELNKRFVGASSDVRCYDCGQDGKEHRDCEVAERIRCLYAFHI
ncbi:uncharacterized protein LOC135607506 isoform X1 [Musa acuminata AAA Group]|uniref:Uncharacterized protein n=1 Tax=Musa acuminata subsp. malaccensis TaxID=214687 RepID=A0A804IC04_MUSAM|nr:PREDICTED: uncharacterized protein LOC103972912 isoform X1 [Musa acuminata subsp. malaccensis]